jgi:hypothetical protein
MKKLKIGDCVVWIGREGSYAVEARRIVGEIIKIERRIIWVKEEESKCTSWDHEEARPNKKYTFV